MVSSNIWNVDIARNNNKIEKMKHKPTKQEIKNVKGCLTKSGQIAVWIVATLVILKITGVLSWSWWWILSPIWIPTSLSLTAWITTEIMGILKK